MPERRRDTIPDSDRTAITAISTATVVEKHEPLLRLGRGERIADRWVIQGWLGGGGFAEVYRVVDDRDPGKELALKLHRLTAASDVALEALRGEFAVLASLIHPNLARVHDFGWVGNDVAFFTQDLVDGVRVRDANVSIDSPDGVDMVAQMCRAIDYLHSHGILHRDIKPSNVMIGHLDDHVTLLDFGVAVALGNPSPVTAGTPAYMAPEAITGAPLDARSDLYSLGVTLYELAAGRTPFRGPARKLYYDHVFATPPRLTEEEIAPGVATIIHRLLSKEPGDRYASAGEVLHALRAVTGVDVHLDTDETLTSYVLSTRVVARQELIDDLGDLLLNLDSDRAPIVIVGEAGSGKSRLLRELQHRVQLEGNAWVRVEPDRAASGSDLVEDVARAVIGPNVVDALDNEDRVELARALPELKKPRERLAVALDPDRAHRARVHALGRAIGWASVGRRLVIAIEDLQWRRPWDFFTLERLVDATKRAGANCIFLVTSRPDARAERLARATDALRASTTRLSPEDCRSAVESMFGDGTLLDGTEMGEALANESHTALWLHESLRLAVERGAVIRRKGRWRLAGPIPSMPLSEVLRKRIDFLPDRARRLSVAMAVIAAPISAVAVAAVGRTRMDRIAEPLGLLLRAGIVEDAHDVNGRRLYAMHDRFVDAVLAVVPEREIRETHLAAARWLTRRRDDARALGQAAEHLAEVGSSKASKAFARAARVADDVGRPDLAVRFLERQIATLDRRGARPPIALLLELFDRARKAGLGDAAQDALAELGKNVRRATEDERVEIDLRRSAWELTQGRSKHTKRALARARKRARSAKLTRFEPRIALLEADVEREFGRFDKALSEYRHAAASAAEQGDELTEAIAWQGAAFTAIYASQPDESERLAARAVQAARAAGDRALLSDALRQLGNAQRYQNKIRASAATQRKAVAAARRCGSIDREAKALNNLGVVAEWLGRLAEALRAMDRAVRLKERIGSTASALVSRNNRAAIWLACGRYDDAEDELRALLLAVEGESDPPTIVTPARGNLAEIAVMRGDLDAAAELYDQAIRHGRERNAGPLLAHPLSGAIRMLCMRGDGDSLDEALVRLRSLEEITAELPTEQSRFRTTAAMVADARGDHDEALRIARKAWRHRTSATYLCGILGSRMELEWIDVLMAQRAGHTERAQKKLLPLRKKLFKLAVRLDDEEQRRAFLNAPIHRAVAKAELDAPPGWTWKPVAPVSEG